jgi:hypothetical protein
VAEVELTENTLIVHVRGMDRLWALKSRLEIPLAPRGGSGDRSGSRAGVV